MNKKILVIAGVLVLVIAGILLLQTTSQKSKTQNSTTQPSSNNFPAPKTITATTQGFTPSVLTIKAGERVVWTNNSGATVILASADHPTHKKYPPLNLGEFANGSSVQLQFNTPGTYSYHNHLNPSQTGTIIVQ